MLRNIVLVFIGGGAGSALRYLTSVLMARHITTTFPFAIFTVNIAGCFLIGLLTGFFNKQELMADANLRFLLITGFCGGYTTFSTFASENLHLLQSGNHWTAAAYIAASAVVGIAAVFGGMYLVK